MHEKPVKNEAHPIRSVEIKPRKDAHLEKIRIFHTTGLRHLLYGFLLLAAIIILTIVAIHVGRWQQSQAANHQPSASQPADFIQSAILAEAQKRHDRLVAGVNDPIQQINPLYAAGDSEWDIVSLVFEPLARLDPEGTVTAHLASHWSYNRASNQLNVSMRTDHTFRDGRVVNPSDVVYTYRCLLSDAYDGPLKGRMAGLSDVTRGTDDHSVVFHFSGRTTEPDLRLLTVGILKSDYYPYKPEQIFELREGNLHPEGSGAFYMSEHSVNHAVLRKRPGYAGQVTTIEFKQVSSEAKFRLLQEGQLDVVRNLWDARMQQRALSLPAYNIFPYTTSIDSYLLVNPNPGPQNLIQRPSQRLGILLTVAGHPLSDLQASSLAELVSRELILYYFQGVDRNVLYDNREQAEQLAKKLQQAGLTVIPKATDWPDLAERATHNRYDLLLLPATANSRLPSGAVILDKPSQPAATALVVSYRPEVMITCKRLSQWTLNPYAYPFAASAGSWTDRIENIRIEQPDDENEVAR